MPTVTYRDNKTTTPQHYWMHVSFFAALSALVIAGMVLRYLGTATLSWIELAFACLFVVATLTVHASHAGWFGLRDRLQARLSADQDGLAHSDGVSTRRWPWRDLSRFEHVEREAGAYIRYRARSVSWRTLSDMHLTRHGWEFRIIDTYDAPLSDIAAKLNEYRDRALGGERATVPE